MSVAACLYVRNERRDIAEWIAFHHAVGFDAFVIFDNMSDDGTREVVRRAARLYDIRLVPWPWTFRFSQVAAYTLCASILGRGFDWIAFIDSDEFLTPIAVDSVQALLAPLEAFDAIALNYRFFGSSGHIAYPEALVVEAFTHRAPDDFQPHHLVKSLVRPRRGRVRNVHTWSVRGRYGTPSGQDVDWSGADATTTPDVGVAQVNHYFTRSRAHWEDKISRGYRGPFRRRDGEFEAYDRNEVVDLSAARFAPAVRRELERLEG